MDPDQGKGAQSSWSKVPIQLQRTLRSLPLFRVINFVRPVFPSNLELCSVRFGEKECLTLYNNFAEELVWLVGFQWPFFSLRAGVSLESSV